MSDVIKEIVVEQGKIALRADGIIEIHSTDHFEYDVKHVLENYDYIKKLKTTEKALILNVVGYNATMTKEVREYVAKGYHQSFIKAEAFVIKSLAHKLLANFYLKINKPIVPTGFFNSKVDAEKWLKILSINLNF